MRPASAGSGSRFGLRLLRDATHGVNERGEVISGGGSRFEIGRQTDNLPAQRRGEILRVFLAQVIRVGIRDGRKGADNDG